MKSRLTDLQIAKIKSTLTRARSGQSTLADLGAAHDLCQSADLAGTAAELRSHIRAMAADKAETHRAAGRDVFTGVVSGIVTHMLLGAS
jgi:chromosome condensin MukBEF ATPase and DNA-binding subunit MukB